MKYAIHVDPSMALYHLIQIETGEHFSVRVDTLAQLEQRKRLLLVHKKFDKFLSITQASSDAWGTISAAINITK